jgi:electron-transferring-flavoprotein dehydrogenase
MFAALRRPLALPVASTSRLPVVVARRPQLAARRFLATTLPRRSSSDEGEFPPATPDRAEDDVDVCIVGAGPAGLCAAIRLKQLELANPGAEERRVIVLEKGAEVGSHILSGAVIETKALDELLPNWKELGAPVRSLALDLPVDR